MYSQHDQHSSLSAFPEDAKIHAGLRSIVDKLYGRAHLDKRYGCKWNDAEVSDVAELKAREGPYLYQGTLGVAFFLAAYYDYSQDVRSRQLALAILAPLALTLQRAVDSKKQLRVPIGGFVGLGSLLYGLRYCGQWLNSPRHVALANGLLINITEEAITSDRSYDVVSGAAGMILALHQFRSSKTNTIEVCAKADEVTSMCVTHLLGAMSNVYKDTGWRSWSQPALLGFAHGGSGICAALCGSNVGGQAAKIADVVAGVRAYEHGCYSESAGDYIDPRTGAIILQNAWCNGALGIAFSRGMCSQLADPQVACDRAYLKNVLTKRSSVGDLHLCCGLSGKYEVLHSLRAWDSNIEASSHRCLRNLVTAVLETLPRSPRLTDRSLMFGLSGVGYTLLRCLESQRYPQLLALG